MKFEIGRKEGLGDKRCEVSFMKFNAHTDPVRRNISNLLKGVRSVMNILTSACNTECFFINAWSTSLFSFEVRPVLAVALQRIVCADIHVEGLKCRVFEIS